MTCMMLCPLASWGAAGRVVQAHRAGRPLTASGAPS